MKIWRLGKSGSPRFRSGHPWIFTSELAHSSKEVWPGEVVELRDFQDHFLAYGYTHPSSQICFRRLSSRAKESDVLSERYFRDRLTTARQLRKAAGWASASHRWLFAENDGVPGLVIDAFRTVGHWIIVVQASTAGIESALPALFAALQSFKSELGDMTVVEAPSSKSRALEGLKVGEKTVVSGSSADLNACNIFLRHDLTLQVDILNGQKTGFFLDQQWNAGLLRNLVSMQFAGFSRPVRVLDICCYVGQWSAHVAHALRAIGVESQVTLFDASASALALAERNLGNLTTVERSVRGDALVNLPALPEGHFDVVICDPPAFVKKKADMAQGSKAYAKINRDALRVTAIDGLYVASSCSGLVRGETWQEVLIQSSQKAGRAFKELARGGHGPDHPVRPEFPEGEYLKCSIARIAYPY